MSVSQTNRHSQQYLSNMTQSNLTMKVAFVTLYLIAAVVHDVAGCLHFEAIPSTIRIGLDKQILLNCTFQYREDSAITNVTHISLSKYGQNIVHEMATIKRPQVISYTSFISDLIPEGYIDSEGISTLIVRWNRLVPEDAGTYICTVKGLDRSGLVHEITETLPVTFKVSQELCQDWKPTARKIFSIPFFPPQILNGSLYYLSKSSTNDSSEAEAFCVNYGGYLIEVDDMEELHLVYQLSKLYNIKSTFIAGTDADQDGVWIFPRTRNPVQIFNWDNSEPNNLGGNENCRVMHFESREDRINDINCKGWDFNFMCEVNESP